MAGFGILATFILLTAAAAAIFTVSTIAAPSAAISASFAVSDASAVAATFSILLISVRFLLTAGDLEFAAFQGRVSCTG